MNILILSSAPKCKAVRSIIQAGEKRGHSMIVKDPRWLYLLISDRINGYDAIYDGFGQDEKPVKLKSSEIHAVIPRIGTNLNYSLSVLEHLNHNLKIFSSQTAIGVRTASDKLISQQKFSQAKLKTPRTVLGDDILHPDWMIKQIGGLPAIGKTITGSLGNGVYILESPLQTNVFLQNFAKKKYKLLLQSFISSGDIAKDIRAIVIDNKVIVAMQRTAKQGEIRANLDKGGTGAKIQLSTEDQDICVRACQAVGLSCAGIDLIKDKDGVTYVIEANGNYGYKVEKVTGVDISTPLIEYCERNYKSGNRTNLNTLTNFFGLNQGNGGEVTPDHRLTDLKNRYPASFAGIDQNDILTGNY